MFRISIGINKGTESIKQEMTKLEKKLLILKLFREITRTLGKQKYRVGQMWVTVVQMKNNTLVNT